MHDYSIPDKLHHWSRRTHYGLTVRGQATEDHGRPLIHFLHGNGMCGLVYWSMLEPLTEHYDIIMTDVQGHGDSDTGERFLGWNRNAAIAAAVLEPYREKYPQRPVYALAHSLGAVLSTLMAARDASLFSRMVLLDPVYFSRGMLTTMASLQLLGLLDRLSPLSRRARARRELWPSRAAAETYLRGRGVFKGWEKASLQHFVHYALHRNQQREVELKCPPWIEAKFFGTYPEGLWRAIKQLSVTTELVMATDTFPFAQKSADKAIAINRNIHQHHFSGSHCFMMERPQQCANEILNLLSKHQQHY